MGILRKVHVTDHEKIKDLSREKLERLVSIIAEFHSDIEELDAGLLHKLFENCITSDEFAKLDKARKKKIFSCYSNLRYITEQMHQFCYENRLGEFNY